MSAQAGTVHFRKVPDLAFPALVHSSRADDETLRRTVRLMAEETGPETFVRQQRATMGRPDSRPFLSRITCPTLVLAGADDALIPPGMSDEIAAGISGSRLVVVPNCGHLSTLEQPEQVTRELVALLDS